MSNPIQSFLIDEFPVFLKTPVVQRKQPLAVALFPDSTAQMVVSILFFVSRVLRFHQTTFAIPGECPAVVTQQIAICIVSRHHRVDQRILIDNITCISRRRAIRHRASPVADLVVQIRLTVQRTAHSGLLLRRQQLSQTIIRISSCRRCTASTPFHGSSHSACSHKQKRHSRR